MDKVYINTDGGSRGNPGPAAIGVVFCGPLGEEIHNYNECIGVGTNNDAEYKAIIAALKILVKSQWFLANNLDQKEVICRLDSKLVVEQVNGNYKIKEERIKVYVAEIKEIISQIKLRISFIYVPREQNKRADELVNQALDAELGKSKNALNS